MEAPKPTPLTQDEEALLNRLIAKLTDWEKLLKLGKPGANRLRHIIRTERMECERRLLSGRAA